MGEDDPTVPAAAWLEAGWRDPSDAYNARLLVAEPDQMNELLQRISVTVQDIASKSPNAEDWFDRVQRSP